MRGKRVGVICPHPKQHFSGTLESSGKRIRCEQCKGESSRQQMAGRGGGSIQYDDVMDQLEVPECQALFTRSEFAAHCVGEGHCDPLDVLEVVRERLSLRVRDRG
jgi:hypothetical protein